MTATATAGAGLDEGLARLPFALPAGAREKLAAYLALLAKWNRAFNLTAIREPERMVTHHLLDSLAVVPLLPSSPGISVLDVGSGGGLPGIPIAIARPDARVVLVDSSHKKATFLAQAAIELPLPNVEALAIRVEDLRPARPFDVVISRAFSDLATFARLASPHVAPGGVMLAMKGVHPHEEIAELPEGVVVAATHRLDVPGLDAARHLIVLRATDAATR
ncbi:MAG: 16S rRNA (guanine(527)-N(7))-methyltransferase RsmG [Burkholderiales bacterium]